MTSPTFGGGHQMEMQFGAPQINVQQIQPGSGHQMEMLRQPPPTSIPPPQVENQVTPVAESQNPPPDIPGEHQIESQQKEQMGKENDSTSKAMESVNDDGDKMDICDTWEQEKVQRLAEEVEKFEQEVMNIERNSLKTSTDNTVAAETCQVTNESERTNNTTTGHDEENEGAAAKEEDLSLQEVEREDVTGNEVKSQSKEKSTEELSEVETNRVAGEGEDVEAKKATDNSPTSEPNTSTVEVTNMVEENGQNKMTDEKTLLPAETNSLFDDAMDLQESSPESNVPTADDA